MISGAVATQGARRARGLVAAPVNTAPPTIAGTILIGESLTVTPGTWTGTPSLSYTLLRGGTPISGLDGVSEATIEAYALVAADMGPALVLRETDSVSATYADSSSLAYDYTLIANSRSWWDLATGVTLADGNTTVDAITDRMGNNNIAAPASTNRPAYSSSDADFNSQPSMAFDGTDDYLKKTAFSWGSSVTAFTFLMVQKLLTNTNGRRVLSYGASGFLNTQSTTNRYTWSVMGTGVTPATAMTSSLSLVLTYDQSNIRVYSNNSLVGGPTAETDAVTDSQDLAISAATAGSFPSNFKTPLFGFVKRVMSSNELASFDAYVSWRFGV